MHGARYGPVACASTRVCGPPAREDPRGSPGMTVAVPRAMPDTLDQDEDELPIEVFDIDELVAEPDDLLDDGEITQRMPRLPHELD